MSGMSALSLYDLSDDSIAALIGRLPTTQAVGRVAAVCSRFAGLVAADELVWQAQLCRLMGVEAAVDVDGVGFRKLVRLFVPLPNGLVTHEHTGNISVNGLTASFRGTLGADQAVRTNTPLPTGEHSAPRGPVASVAAGEPARMKVVLTHVVYFEVSIKSLGDEEGSADDHDEEREPCVSIGMGTSRFPLRRKQPGWDRHSLGYHGDDGHIFHGRGLGQGRFGPSFGADDVVGCGFDFGARTFFFTLNGSLLGHAFRLSEARPRLPSDVYPVVGIDARQRVSLNVGGDAFAFDVHGWRNRSMLLDALRPTALLSLKEVFHPGPYTHSATPVHGSDNDPESSGDDDFFDDDGGDDDDDDDDDFSGSDYSFSDPGGMEDLFDIEDEGDLDDDLDEGGDAGDVGEGDDGHDEDGGGGGNGAAPVGAEYLY